MFVGLNCLGLDSDAEDVTAVQDVVEGGQRRYVLKTQREGGGVNFYGDQLAGERDHCRRRQQQQQRWYRNGTRSLTGRVHLVETTLPAAADCNPVVGWEN